MCNPCDNRVNKIWLYVKNHKELQMLGTIGFRTTLISIKMLSIKHVKLKLK